MCKTFYVNSLIVILNIKSFSLTFLKVLDLLIHWYSKYREIFLRIQFHNIRIYTNIKRLLLQNYLLIHW